ncbi:hypothetical protein BES08_11925 [Novosphingobium resinovorum]|uniref:Uncharacterized protein n=1 Tax=Novosphingobium resinovorum TaxID=158500 RepID=A0A1D8A5H9_9SPHN|nr:hypothetical protein BES08_11925 [Novosphingobium resinovorum]
MDWRIRQAAAALCRAPVAGFGLSFDDIEAYPEGERAMVTRVLRLRDVPQISFVATGSPADRAGLKPGDEVLAMGGITIDRIAQDAPKGSPLYDWLAVWMARAPLGPAMKVTVRRGSAEISYILTAQPLCGLPVVMEVNPGFQGWSDGTRAVVTSGVIERSQSDDEIAMFAGHELAHVLNGDVKASGLRERLQWENDADLLGMNLAICAGYDRKAVLAGWRRSDDKNFFRWLGDPTHGSLKTRIRTLEAMPAPPCPLAPASRPAGLRSAS